MTTHTVYLSLGSNVGDRAAMLKRAAEALREAGVRVRRRSALFESQPVDFPAQHWFLNGVVEAETELLPLPLLHALRRIEFRLGSRKLFARGPRRVDLDILLYGHATIHLPELGVPHPRMHLRRFVLAPLAEMVPPLSHPLWGATAAGLLVRTPDRSRVQRVAESAAGCTQLDG